MEIAWNGIRGNYTKNIVVIIVLVIILAIVGYFFGNKGLYKSDNSPTYTYTTNEKINTVIADANDDNDGDGIENWKENLLGTDPSQANPLPAVASGTSKVSTDTNLTYEVAKSLYASANAMREAGDTTTPTTIAVTRAIADQALNAQKTAVDEKKIIVGSDNSRVALKAYGNELLGAIATYYPKVNEAQVLDRYLNTNDKTVLNDLQPNIDILNFMLVQVYKIKVPSSAYTINKEVLTHISNALDIEKALAKSDSDALASMIAFKQFRELDQSNKELLKGLKDFFDSANVVFGPKDVGSILNNQ